MPYKNTKKRNPKPKATKPMQIETDLYDRLESIAFSRGLINPRNGNGNRSELIKLAVDAFSLFPRTYSDSLPYPQELVYLLHGIAQLIDSEDLETLKTLRSRIQQNVEYLESWGVEIDLKEAIAEGAIKTKSGDWII